MNTPIILGLGMFFAGCALILVFHFLIVVPAFTVSSDGFYGEMLGPVSFFRIPVYSIRGLFIVLGLLLAFVKNRR
jgi:hypothetical protein